MLLTTSFAQTTVPAAEYRRKNATQGRLGCNIPECEISGYNIDRSWIYTRTSESSRRRSYRIFQYRRRAHTATLRVAGAFPAGGMKRMAHKISDVWSTGDIKPNGESSPILVDSAGTYAYGCIHHFNMGQQATIIAEP